ncbi:putative B-block binding subunit of TFIIIC, winged helix-turn-helix DNA-binding protein [Lupinus albus]|uniref:Putative B-block binding subunit of TFIIIC, winged helix-turn-helix DNA-binding protein n=1 Tax=Lupinus albus TaxID=3870 RepID=A0A6A4PV67_LUPAL|nr:putative B-block binding subunit of TFIIIC, winged helix-turn-helix DNA-binding protein [Lupinus albus]
MDTVINAAVEEICAAAQLEEGITLESLWSKLQNSPSLTSSNLSLSSSSVKKAIWTNLIRIPSLRFEPQPSSLEDADAVRIFPQQSLSDNFFGLYDSQTLQQPQMRVLRLLANARSNGITQSQLAKQLRIDANNFHYVLRSLECQGLIVKHSAIEKKKQINNDGEESDHYFPSVATHLVYLHRYAKQQLASHQRFEITKSNSAAKDDDDDEDQTDGTRLQTDVLLKDYAPQMKEICDKLAKANDKVLIVSDIKKELGYCGSRSGHRAWRGIYRQLKADGIVEQFDAKVNGKVQSCLRLLDPVTSGSANEDKNLNSGKKCQDIDLFVELPVEHQIFDMIDAAGSGGISLKEICERLGIELKKNHTRLINLCYRFGIKVQEEQCLKSKTIRVWTSRNFNPEPEVPLTHKHDENKILDQNMPDSSSNLISEFLTSISNGGLADSKKWEDRGTSAEVSCKSPRNIEFNYVETPTKLQESTTDQKCTESNKKHDLISLSVEADIAPSGVFPSDILKPFSNGSFKRRASSSFSVDNTRRANRILERLKDERFILRSEISRWLDSFEKGKSTKMDRKTIDRILAKLQEQGQCKCITVHSPVVSEYSRTRDWVVVLHPSISLSPELIDEIQDRARIFSNGHSRSVSHQKNEELIPVIEDIQKTRSLIVPDGQGGKAEAMRANGFVLAKMVRAKLLHSFLWDYLHKSESHNDSLSSEKCVYELTNNPHSSSKLFSLEAAIKAIPIELFLQVVGSTQKFEVMIEKCKMGLCLSDLPREEYKCLMDTNATGRLSLVIDILRRLKLIRMVTNIQSRDGVRMPHTFTHMMELKPYIEEPLSKNTASLHFISLDLRPRIRHDFILSNRDAVDEYWRTLEYCYVASDKKAASYAFPGSVVHEVYRFRSWASNRLMTAEQRCELLKRLPKDECREKISYKDCEKIAKDINLTLEQVLSVYYSNRRHCYNQLKDEGIENNPRGHKVTSSHHRKKDSTELRPAKHARTDAATNAVGIHMEEHGTHSKEQYNLGIHSKEHDTNLHEFEEDDHYEMEGSEDCCPPISQCVLSKMKPIRQRRFIWSDKTDRQLVIQYVRHRAALGAKYHRIDWASLSDLPAPPRVCRRRMNSLNNNLEFREAVNRLCNKLSEQYAKQLDKSQSWSLNKDHCRQFVRSQSSKGVHNNFSPDVDIQIASHNGEAWDDIEKVALDKILRLVKMDSSSKKVNSHYEGWSDANADGYESQENEEIASATPSETTQNHHEKNHILPAQRSHRRRFDKKFTTYLNKRADVYGRVSESLAISNAVELFKLVFLSTSTGPPAPNLLADILRRYSEHDLFAAFNYLKEKKIMVGGNGTECFELSQQFLHSVSRSPFPFNTGRRAVKFSNWLQEKNIELIEVGVDLVEDLQCGDIFHLFALVSSGELSISPCLPDNGVGEADDLRSTKRKSDVSESSFSEKAKKLKSSSGVEGEIISRREKGFPGIIISARRATLSSADILDLFKDDEKNWQPFEWNHQSSIGQSSNYSLRDHMLEVFNSCDSVPVEENQTESTWEAMAGYAQRLVLVHSNQEQPGAICAEVFRVVYAAIQKAGDQGLSMGEISQVINLPGADVDELIVDVLQAYGQALKVNAYDSVRVVDALYRHKYFLTPTSNFVQGGALPSSENTIKKSDDACKPFKSGESVTAYAETPRGRNTVVDNMHKVTILNLPRVAFDTKNQAYERNKGSMQERLSSRVDPKKETLKTSSDELCVPILPWINGDGTINNLVYKGLKRRLLGIVMQNPGILEDGILQQMHVLNPQSCKTLLELMVLDKHLIVKKMHQNESDGVPSLLRNLIGSKYKQPKMICRDHFFANPLSTSLL